MADFKKAPQSGDDEGGASDFFERVEQFWFESGDVFSPFTRVAFLVLAGLLAVLTLRWVFRTIARRPVPGDKEYKEEEIEDER